MNIKGVFFTVTSIFLLLFFPYWIVKFFAILFLLLNSFSFFYSLTVQNSIVVLHNKNIIRNYKGETVKVELFLKNSSFLHAGNIFIKDNTDIISLSDKGRLFVKVIPRDKALLSYNLNLSARGAFKIGPITMSGIDPLGFYPWTKTINSYCDIIVYPRLYTFYFNTKEGTPSGIFKSHKRIYEDLTQYKSVREYIRGDELKRINWKVSARMNTFFTNIYELTFNSDILFLLNLNAKDYPLRYRHFNIELSIEVLSSMVHFFINKGQRIGLISNGTIDNNSVITEIGRGTEQGVLILELLAKIKEVETDENIFELLKTFSLPSRTTIIFITPSLTESYCNYIDKLKRKNVDLFTFILDDENFRFTSNLLKDGIFNYRIIDKRVVYERTHF